MEKLFIMLYKYPRPAVTADCVVITQEPDAKVRLVQRGGEPIQRCRTFPGGFTDMNETTEQCAIRDLAFYHDDIMQEAITKYREIFK